MTGERTQQLDRATRLVQLTAMFHRNPSGFRVAAIATELGVCIRTIQRDLLTLQDEPFRLRLAEERSGAEVRYYLADRCCPVCGRAS